MTETVTFEEIGMLLGLAAARDQRTVGDADGLAWHADLNAARVEFADAETALTRFYVEMASLSVDKRFRVTSPDIIAIVRKIRSERLENFNYEPRGDETGAEFVARYRGQLQAVASGRTAPLSGRLALEGGPSQQFVQELEARGYDVGRAVPESDEDALVDKVRRAGPLGVECPACGAVIGRPCKLPGGSEKQPLGKSRRKPHSARLRAASGESGPSLEERAAEEARRRAASAATLARMAAEGEIVDAEIVEDAR